MKCLFIKFNMFRYQKYVNNSFDCSYRYSGWKKDYTVAQTIILKRAMQTLNFITDFKLTFYCTENDKI